MFMALLYIYIYINTLIFFVKLNYIQTKNILIRWDHEIDLAVRRMFGKNNSLLDLRLPGSIESSDECDRICLFIYLLIWSGSRFENDLKVSRVGPGWLMPSFEHLCWFIK